MRVLLWTLKSSYAVFRKQQQLKCNVTHTKSAIRLTYSAVGGAKPLTHCLHVKMKFIFCNVWVFLVLVCSYLWTTTHHRERDTHRVVNKSKARFRGGDDASFKRSASEMIDSNIVYFKFCWTFFFLRERCVTTFRANCPLFFRSLVLGRVFSRWKIRYVYKQSTIALDLIYLSILLFTY